MEYGKTDMLFTNHQEQVTEDYCFVQDESSIRYPGYYTLDKA